MRAISLTVLVIGMALANLVLLKLIPFSTVLLTSTTDSDVFNAPPDRDGTVSVPGDYAYRLAPPMSQKTFDKYFGGISASGSAFQDALRVSRRVRVLYRHGEADEAIFPWIPDEAIEKAIKRPVLCGIYAKTAVSALDHMGHVARVVSLRRHVTMEVYDFDEESWVYLDPNGGIYASSSEGTVLGLTEVRRRLSEDLPLVTHAIDSSTDDQIFDLEDPNTRDMFVGGYVLHQDGAGIQYAHLSPAYAGKRSKLVAFKEPHSPVATGAFSPMRLRWGVGAPLLLINAVALASIAYFWRRSRSKSGISE